MSWISWFSRPGRVLRLKPDIRRPRGRVLLSYLREAFQSGARKIPRGHTNHQECRAIAMAWLAEGDEVDVIDRRDRTYPCPKDASVVVDLGHNLPRWAESLPPECLKVYHATGAHWLTQNLGELRRLDALRARRGVILAARRQSLPVAAVESADVAIVLGNEFTAGSYRYAGKPVCRVPISSAYEFSWPSERHWDSARKHFLWLGSYGMVHKGLDLVLEAFAALPDLHLTVCGRPEKEADFWSAYRHELTGLPNISFAGWVDPAGPEFEKLRNTCSSVIYPSCSEGGGGAVIHAMHAGLLPIVTPEASVDIGSFGISVQSDTVEGVREAVRHAADMDTTESEERARAAWEYARTHHTLPRFESNYRNFARRLLTEGTSVLCA